MTNELIREAVYKVIAHYPIKKVVLFGSRADGTNREDSDIDLIMEFNAPISQITLCSIKDDLEDLLGLTVDVIHGPLEPNAMIEVNEVIELYAA